MWLVISRSLTLYSSSKCLCKSLRFYSRSNFVDWLSGSAWLRLLSVNTVLRAHDWASSIRKHTHTNFTGSKACHSLVVGGWGLGVGGGGRSTLFLPPPPSVLSDSDRHVCIAPAVSQVTRSGVQLPPALHITHPLPQGQSSRMPDSDSTL